MNGLGAFEGRDDCLRPDPEAFPPPGREIDPKQALDDASALQAFGRRPRECDAQGLS